MTPSGLFALFFLVLPILNEVDDADRQYAGDNGNDE
jgi:hypothetical protein